MKKENKRHLILSIVLIVSLVIYFMTGCVSYYIIIPESPGLTEKHDKFTNQFLEADNGFDSMPKINYDQIDSSVKRSVKKLKEEK